MGRQRVCLLVENGNNSCLLFSKNIDDYESEEAFVAFPPFLVVDYWFIVGCVSLVGLVTEIYAAKF